ncbi:MAG: flagellar hook-basal body complex protein, partial [Sphingopyxis sp.]
LIARFPNPEGLRQEGDARWRMTTTSGEATIGSPGSNGFNELQLGALEQSNIDLTEELVRLITAQRNFQANAKAIDTANAMTQAIINLRN